MAKNATPATPKAPKTKNSKQKAKAESNIKAAQERLMRLQAQQRLVNAKRAQGFIGNDNTILRLIEAEERVSEAAKSKEYVDKVLSSPYGSQVSAWLGTIKGDPCKVAQVIRNYVATQGWKNAV